jgi:hypothetical protein
VKLTFSVAAIAALALPAIPAAAGVTSTVSVQTYKDFNEGEADAAFITSLGEVRPGWTTNKTDLPFEGTWSALQTSDGLTLLGSAQDGAIFAVNNGAVSKLGTIPGVLAVVSMAEGPGGVVYAGTMPGGQIWKVDASSGKSTKLATLAGAETVWSLAMSGDTLYAGTGPKAEVFAVTSSGASRSIFVADDKRVLSMTTTADGAVWFGTSEKALLYRYDPKRRSTRAMADFSGNEVTALAPYRGGVIAAANELTETTTAGVKTARAVDQAEAKGDKGDKAKAPKAGSTPGADKSASAGAEPPRKGGRKGKGALWYVRGDSALEELHALSATYFTALAVTDDGRVFAGSADKGRVFLIDKNQSVSTAFDVDQRRISALLWNPKTGVSFATDDATNFYTTGPRSKQAIYTSQVFDLKAPSRFGRLVWRGSSSLKVETRSGNTSDPGPGWSKWVSPRGVARSGGGASGGKVISPTGRYAQFRVKFTGDAAEVLRAAKLYYLPQNKPTKIEDIEIEPKEKQPDMVTTSSGAIKPRSPVLKVSWKIDNPDKDKSVYHLEVRREGEARWRRLTRRDEPETKTTFEWNTETFPDGFYRLRVIASDRAANSISRARDSHKTTELFLVDNERPQISGLTVKVAGRGGSATAKAADAMSAIAELAYSVDDGVWRIGNTRDGLFDELTEMIQISLPPDLSPGLHTLAIRVADEAGNIGSAAVSFRVGQP